MIHVVRVSVLQRAGHPFRLAFAAPGGWRDLVLCRWKLYYVVSLGSVSCLHCSLSGPGVSRGGTPLCLAERLTALAAAEEAIAVDLNTLVDPATLSRATSPSFTPRTPLTATCVAFGGSEAPSNRRSVGIAASEPLLK